MFKKSIFTLMLMAAIGTVSAQSLRFELDGTVFEEGETIEDGCKINIVPAWMFCRE